MDDGSIRQGMTIFNPVAFQRADFLTTVRNFNFWVLMIFILNYTLGSCHSITWKKKERSKASCLLLSTQREREREKGRKRLTKYRIKVDFPSYSPRKQNSLKTWHTSERRNSSAFRTKEHWLVPIALGL